MPRVHVFQSSTDPNLYGYTAERTGDALPRARRGSKWTYLREIAVFPGNTQTAVNAADMLGNIGRRGYHLFSTEPRDAHLRGGGQESREEGSGGHA
jgi:hypothetical protein